MKNAVYYIIIGLSVIVIVYSLHMNGSRDNGLAKSTSAISNDSIPMSEIKILNPTIDFGTVYRDTILTARYSIANTGINPLIIYYINPDCSCTSIEYNRKPIMPQDTSTVILTLNTKDKIGSQTLHSVLKVNTEISLYKLTMKVDVMDNKPE